VTTGNFEHVLGEVDAHRRPAELGHRCGRQACPAADVETSAIARAEQPLEGVELVRLQRRAETFVPLGDAVIPHVAHAGDASQASPRRRAPAQPLRIQAPVTVQWLSMIVPGAGVGDFVKILRRGRIVVPGCPT
jgi:hypothetical protein